MLGNTFAEIIILIYNSIIVWQYLNSWRQTTPYQRQPSFNSTKSHYNRIKDSQTVLMQIWNADCTARASHVKSELQLNKEALIYPRIPGSSVHIIVYRLTLIPRASDRAVLGDRAPQFTQLLLQLYQVSKAELQFRKYNYRCFVVSWQGKIKIYTANHWNKNKVHSTIFYRTIETVGGRTPSLQ